MSIKFRTAQAPDTERLNRLYSHQYGQPAMDAQIWACALDRCVLIAQNENQWLASAGIDLASKEIIGLHFESESALKMLGSRLICKIEQLAAQFDLYELRIKSASGIDGLLRSCGYRDEVNHQKSTAERSGEIEVFMSRSFPRRETRYSRRIAGILADLGISRDYGRSHRMTLQGETRILRDIGPDIYQRQQKMLPQAADSWLSMKQAAEMDEIQIQAVSAFRSVSYQAGLLRKKIQRGLDMQEILAVSAAPGYSEHHTGRAIDVTTPGFPVLEEDFESSPAFAWLQTHASTFGFSLSFPRDNRHKVGYEPWHWAWWPVSAD